MYYKAVRKAPILGSTYSDEEPSLYCCTVISACLKKTRNEYKIRKIPLA
jgi:hypothetical protein